MTHVAFVPGLPNSSHIIGKFHRAIVGTLVVKILISGTGHVAFMEDS